MTRFLTVVAVVLAASACGLGQTPKLSRADFDPIGRSARAKPLSYADGVAKSAESGRPLVTFVGTDSQVLSPRFVVARADALAGFPTPSVVVSVYTTRGHFGRATPTPFPVDEQEIDAVVESLTRDLAPPANAPAGEVVVYDVTAKWCGPCAKFAPKFAAMKARLGRPGLRFETLDFDDSPERAASLGVTSLPTVVVTKGGVVVDRFGSTVSDEDVLKHAR